MKTNMKFLLRTAVLPLILLILTGCTASDRYVLIQGYAQGGTYSVKINLKTSGGIIRKSPEKLKKDIDSILYSIDTTLSGYNKGSLLSRFNAGGRIPVRPGGMFADMYSRAYAYYEETGGALDVASAPLFDLWGFGFKKGSMPSESEVYTAKASCGMNRLKKDLAAAAAPDGTISGADLLTDSLRSENGVPAALPELNFNAIAQGYSCDLVAAYLYSLGIKDMLVDIGEIYCDGVNPEGKPWRVGVDRPVDGNNAPGQDLDGIWQSDGRPCGIVTSGNYRKFYTGNDGKKYAHTIDPRTGCPVQHNLLSATIVAPNATDADAYATYCMVIGLDAAREFIGSRAGELSGYLIYCDDEGRMREWASDGFSLVE